MLLFKTLLSSCALLLMCGDLWAQTVRDQEIDECRTDEIAVWPDGIDRPVAHAALHVIYQHDGAPGWFEAARVANLVSRAAQEWTKCGIPLTVVARDTVAPQGTGTVRVQWSDKGSMDNFGLANLTQRTLSLGPKAFGMLRDRNPAHDALQTLQMVISHEMGHFLGLMAHSRRCVDVLSYYHDGKGSQCFSRDPAGMRAGVEYRHVLPTACDIARCRRVNGMGGLPAQ